MKNHTVFFIALLAWITTTVNAQPTDKGQRVMDRIREAQWREIKKEMNWDEDKVRQVKPIYLKYTDELSAVGFRSRRDVMSLDPDLATKEEAQEALRDHFTDTEQQWQIRKKYYQELSRVLSPQEQVRLMQTEARVRQKVIGEVRERRQRRRQ
jgi:hypothetical protein